MYILYSWINQCLGFIYFDICVINAIVRLPRPSSGDRLDHELYLSLSTYNETQNYEKKGSNHHPLPS